MDWGFLFSATNSLALIGWLLLAFTPRGSKIHAMIFYLGVGLLCLVYAVGLISVLTANGGFGDGGGFGSITEVRALFASDAGIVIGWTHYLAFDLFVGQWVAKDADAKGFSRIVQLPILFLVLMAGPLGLFCWLLLREGRARKAARG